MTGVTSRFAGGGGNAFNPAPGTYVDSRGGNATCQFTITASAPLVWTWSQTQIAGTGGGSADVISGNSAGSITFSVAGPGSGTRTVQFDVTAGGNTWRVTLTSNAGGGGVGVTMTL